LPYGAKGRLKSGQVGSGSTELRAGVEGLPNNLSNVGEEDGRKRKGGV